MKKLHVLMLGWDFLPQENEEQETNSFGMAKALANKVALTLILPKADPDVVLQNVDLTGLNNVNLQAINPDHMATLQPFAAANYERLDIPLYGSSVVSPQETKIRQEPENYFLNPGTEAEFPEIRKSRKINSEEVENIFDQPDWDGLNLDSKVIQYARFATRYAAGRSFDLIYAHNWLTFLAGNELKLVTDKPLALQVNTLCQERGHPDNQGWMYELEKLAFQRSDYIFTSTREKAATMVEAYQIAKDKIIVVSDARPVAATYAGQEPVNNVQELPTISEKDNAYWRKTVECLLKKLDNSNQL